MSLSEILDIAKFLLSNPLPQKKWAWARSIANRSYYGALHKISSHLDINSWEGHEKVPDWLKQQKMAQTLINWRLLQAARIYSDYFDSASDFKEPNLREGGFKSWFSHNTGQVNSAISVSAENFADYAYELAKNCLADVIPGTL